LRGWWLTVKAMILMEIKELSYSKLITTTQINEKLILYSSTIEAKYAPKHPHNLQIGHLDYTNFYVSTHKNTLPT